MESLNILNNRKKSPTQLTRNSKLFKSIIAALEEKKGRDIVSLDLRKIPEAVADFFVICTGGSNTQVAALAGYVEEHVKKECDEWPYHSEGQQNAQWVLVDYVNVVVHVFQEDQRQFYRLEEMWSDADRKEHR